MLRGQKIFNRIYAKQAKITIIGGGYVGLPLAVRCAKVGYEVTIYDIDQKKVNSINRGESYISDVPSKELAAVAPRLLATVDPNKAITESDIVVICVPTPLNKTKDPDISMVVNAVYMIRDFSLPPYTERLVILESTVYPGFTREVLVPMLDVSHSMWHGNLFVAFSPERVDPSNKDFGVQNTPKVIGGLDEESAVLATGFYSDLVSQIVRVSSCDAAEMTKVIENTFRMVNIALANETALECQKLGLDVWEVIGAAATKPFGFMPFWPGPGVGGHCIGLDPHYLAWKLRSLNYRSRFIELAEQINSAMPECIVRMTIDSLSRFRQQPIMNASVLVLGVAYKPNVSDVRESPALDIIRLLSSHGACVRFFDPYVESIRLETPTRVLSRVDDLVVAARDADCVLIVTDHRNVDYRAVCEVASLVVDSRNATKDLREEFSNKIVVL